MATLTFVPELQRRFQRPEPLLECTQSSNPRSSTNNISHITTNKQDQQQLDAMIRHAEVQMFKMTNVQAGLGKTRGFHQNPAQWVLLV